MSESEDAASHGARRRRVWPADLKQRIVAEACEPGASAAEVARRYGLNANLLFTWRRQLRASDTAAEKPLSIVPVAVLPETRSARPSSSSRSAGRMEIVLAGGERIIVDAQVETAALARVLEALSRR